MKKKTIISQCILPAPLGSAFPSCCRSKFVFIACLHEHFLICSFFIVQYFSHSPDHQIAPAKAQFLLPPSLPCVYLHLHILLLNIKGSPRRHFTEQSPMSRCFGDGKYSLAGAAARSDRLEFTQIRNVDTLPGLWHTLFF